jgi:hypothetical protein
VEQKDGTGDQNRVGAESAREACIHPGNHFSGVERSNRNRGNLSAKCRPLR